MFAVSAWRARTIAQKQLEDELFANRGIVTVDSASDDDEDTLYIVEPDHVVDEVVCVDGPQLDEQDPFGVVVPVPVPVTEVPVTVYPVVIADLNGSGGAASEFVYSSEAMATLSGR